MSKSSKRLPATPLKGLSHGKPHSGDYGGGLGSVPVHVAQQHEPTEGKLTRQQYNFAAEGMGTLGGPDDAGVRK